MLWVSVAGLTDRVGPTRGVRRGVGVESSPSRPEGPAPSSRSQGWTSGFPRPAVAGSVWGKALGPSEVTCSAGPGPTRAQCQDRAAGAVGGGGRPGWKGLAPQVCTAGSRKSGLGSALKENPSWTRGTFKALGGKVGAGGTLLGNRRQMVLLDLCQPHLVNKKWKFD